MNTRNLIIITILIVSSFIGMRGYTYFFDTSEPSVKLRGIERQGYYAGDVECLVSTNKKGTMSVSIDGHSVVDNMYVKSSKDGHSFTIPTRTLSNGKHQFKCVLKDSTYHQNAVELNHEFTVDNTPLQLAFLKEEELKVFQGRTLHLQFQANKPLKEAKIKTLSQTYDCIPESKDSLVYECFIPVACEEHPSEYLLSLDARDLVNNDMHVDHKFQVVEYPFKRVALQISEEKIKEEEQLGPDNKRFEEEIEQLVLQSPKQKMWKGAFCTPIEIQRVTGEFGTIRTTQHKGRYAHKALDVVNQPKSVVWAPQDGIVVLKDRFAMSGNTVIIDHGFGILSMFFHLDSFANVEIGDKICKGNPLGTIGKTGYALGYHLHWEMRVNNIAVDPMQWTKLNF